MNRAFTPRSSFELCLGNLRESISYMRAMTYDDTSDDNFYDYDMYHEIMSGDVIVPHMSLDDLVSALQAGYQYLITEDLSDSLWDGMDEDEIDADELESLYAQVERFRKSPEVSEEDVHTLQRELRSRLATMLIHCISTDDYYTTEGLESWNLLLRITRNAICVEEMEPSILKESYLLH